MRLRCKYCGRRGIGLLHAMVYSTSDPILCLLCGRRVAVPRVWRWLFGFVISAVVLAGVIASFVAMHPWPLVLAIALGLALEVLMIPAFSRVVEETWSPKK